MHNQKSLCGDGTIHTLQHSMSSLRLRKSQIRAPGDHTCTLLETNTIIKVSSSMNTPKDCLSKTILISKQFISLLKLRKTNTQHFLRGFYMVPIIWISVQKFHKPYLQRRQIFLPHGKSHQHTNSESIYMEFLRNRWEEAQQQHTTS